MFSGQSIAQVPCDVVEPMFSGQSIAQVPCDVVELPLENVSDESPHVLIIDSVSVLKQLGKQTTIRPIYRTTTMHTQKRRPALPS
jgi:hypothetical protein